MGSGNNLGCQCQQLVGPLFHNTRVNYRLVNFQVEFLKDPAEGFSWLRSCWKSPDDLLEYPVDLCL